MRDRSVTTEQPEQNITVFHQLCPKQHMISNPEAT